MKKNKKPEYGIDKECRDGRLQGTLREVSDLFELNRFLIKGQTKNSRLSAGDLDNLLGGRNGCYN